MSGSVRPYDSPTRRQQAELTREKILSAFADQLGRGGVEDLSAAEAAVIAGVALRTVYHYFPDRDARMQGLAGWVDRQLQPETMLPATADDLPELVRRTYQAVRRNESLLRAQMATGIAAEVRLKRRRERVAAIHRVIDDIGAPESIARPAAALVCHLTSADAALPLIDNEELTLTEATTAAVRAVELIVADLRRAAAAHPA